MHTPPCMCDHVAVMAIAPSRPSRSTLDAPRYDIGPFIIARHVILFQLMSRASPAQYGQLWCVFCSRWLDRVCWALLRECASELPTVGPHVANWHLADCGRSVWFAQSTKPCDLAQEI